MAASDHRVKKVGSVDLDRSSSEAANRSRPPLHFRWSTREESSVAKPSEHVPVSSDDVRSLIHLSTACIACFEFDTPISTSSSASELIEQVYSVPSRCTEANLRLALHTDRATSDDALGLPLGEVLPRSFGYDSLFRRWHACSLSGQSFEIDVLAYDSSPIVLQSVVYARILDDSFSRIWLVLRDVTVHARAVQALARAEVHYRSLVERPGMMLVRFRPDGWYEYMSPSVQEILGYSIRDFNAHPRLILQLVHPEDVAKLEKTGHFERVAQSEPVESEFRLRIADGSYHWFFSRHTPKRAPSGEVEYIDLMCMDIQRHKELEEELAHRNKATLVSQTAAGIAHDLNNYLTAIRGQVEASIQVIDPQHAAQASLQEARETIAACAQMTRQLLDTGQIVANQRTRKAVSSILRDAVSLAKHLIPPSVTLHVEPCQHDLVIECSSSEMQQALLNIILNARDALNGNGVIVLGASRLPEREGVSSDQVAIRIRDNGSGIPSEFIDRVFEPYFTTKGPRRGTGLGLSNVRSSIEAQGGRIELWSSVGVGTEFSIIFPLLDSALPQAPSKAPLIASPEQALSVLVADDDEGVRNIILSNLARMGHRAYGVGDGQALLSMLQEGATSFDAIIVDDSMPKARGLDLIERLRLLVPNAKLILTSGDPRIRQLAARLEYAPLFLAKPFGLEELNQVLTQTTTVQ